jgi:hypothetical protein
MLHAQRRAISGFAQALQTDPKLRSEFEEQRQRLVIGVAGAQ